MNIYDKELKERVIGLRRQGHTFREIQSQLGEIPKTTLSYMCRNVQMPSTYKDKVHKLNIETLKSARVLAYEAKNQITAKHLAIKTTEAIRVVESIEEIDKQKVALAVLYLGEGRKRSSFRGLSLGGSDVNALRIYVSLLRECYGIEESNLRAAVQYRADQDVDVLKLYWGTQLGLSMEQFYQTKPDPRTAGKPTRRADYMGVCVITCRGADIQLELSLIAEQYAKKLWGYSSVD